MGVPTSEVGYTLATTGREDHEFIRDMWWHWMGCLCESGSKGSEACFIMAGRQMFWPIQFTEDISEEKLMNVPLLTYQNLINESKYEDEFWLLN
jgi:hypothetical protein